MVADEVAGGQQGVDQPGVVVPALAGDEEEPVAMDLGQGVDDRLDLVRRAAVVEGEREHVAVARQHIGHGGCPAGRDDDRHRVVLGPEAEGDGSRCGNRHRDVVQDGTIQAAGEELRVRCPTPIEGRSAGQPRPGSSRHGRGEAEGGAGGRLPRGGCGQREERDPKRAGPGKDVSKRPLRQISLAAHCNRRWYAWPS